jgi:hypothetical protein
MAIPRWKWLEKVGASEEAEKEKAKPIPKPTVIEKTVSKTTTARRRRLEHTQEFADVGRSSVSETMPKPTVISDRHKQTDAGKLAFIRQITGHGKENIPEKIRDLGPSAEREYAVTAYKTQRGVIPYEQGIERIQSGFETRLREGSLPTSLRWMKEHGTFTSDGKAYTWSELKEKHPRLEMKRESGEFVIYEKPFDYTAWREEQYATMDPFSASVRRGAATFLGGFANWDYIYASQTGDPTDITKQQSKLGAVIDKWEYDTIHNIESGNVLGVVTGIPAVTNILAPYGLGVGIGAIYKGVYGASALLASKGLEHTGKVLERGAKGIGIGIGAFAVGTAGLDVYATYQQDQEKALTKALTYGTQFFSLGIGMRTGSRIKLPERSFDITHYKLTGQPEYFTGQKYIDVFGRHIKYGRPRYSTNVNLGLGTGKPVTAPGEYVPPDLGYRSVGGRPLSIFDAKMTAPTPKTSGLGIFEWNKTTFVDTWKPTPSEWIKDVTAIQYFDFLKSKGAVALTIYDPDAFPAWEHPGYDVYGITRWDPTSGKFDIGISKRVYPGERMDILKHELLHVEKFIERSEAEVRKLESGPYSFKLELPLGIRYARTQSVQDLMGLFGGEFIRALSTRVHPKPVVKGAYEWRFGVIDYTPFMTAKLSNLFGKNIYKIEPDILIKPAKSFVDMGKVLKTQETKLDTVFKDTGGVSSGGTGQQTIQLQETKSIAKEILKTKTITEQLSAQESLSIRHPLYGQELISKSELGMLQERLSAFKPMYKTKLAYGIVQIQKQRSGLLFAPMYESKLAYDTVSIFEQRSVTIPKFDVVAETVFDIPRVMSYPSKPDDIFIPDVPPPTYIPPPPFISTPIPPFLPSPHIPFGHYKKKKKWLEIDGARKRVHPVTLLKIPKIPFQEVNI